jgi:anti-sigma factor RsiW
MLESRRGTLSPAQIEELHTHVEHCAACRHDDAADAELSRALARLGRYPVSPRLRRRLNELVLPVSKIWRRLGQATAGAALVGAVAAATALVLRAQDRSDAMFAEAVSDHLRLLYSEHPIEIESGGIHQVKPWFAGKVDFAPALQFGGDADFPLRGGSVAYFLDRKAAALIFSRRLHTVSLFVFRADGMPWPVNGGEQLGARRAFFRTPRGFRVLLWRDEDLGYALVSDLNPTDLRELGKRLAGP